ncbi:hypothetical protein [Nocardia panacis]|uniref:hypothetical protein n=1 Tax=Nocardia panacis TaxID=2340916 RepID=UPI0011C49730|nr:hypothetical protein [Nocardia panacis]
MTEPVREKAVDPEFGGRRWRRYVAAFDRVQHCVEEGYHLEAIAVLDSLISDRLTSRLTHLDKKELDQKKPPTVGQACASLIGGKRGPGVENNPEIRAVVIELSAWADRRNEAMHAMAKILHNADPDTGFDDLLRSQRQTAQDGISLLQAFDRLDTRERWRSGIRPGTWPNAFFPAGRKGRALETR